MADYASTSGIALRLENEIWVNAPIRDFNPNFIGDSPYRLEFANGEFWIQSYTIQSRAWPAPVPAFALKSASSGQPFGDFGLTHTDRVRISPIQGCIGMCRFCDLARKYEYRTKPVAALVETVAVALRDPVLTARHVLISGGTPKPSDFDYLNDVYRTVISRFPGVAVDIMMVPLPGLLDLSVLHDMGVNGLAINLEVFDEETARALMPLKGALPRTYWLDFLERAAGIFGAGRIRSLLIVGLEPMRQTLKGVEALAQRGCEPVLSPFRPDPATELRDSPPPTADYLAEIYERSVEVAARYGAKLGPRCIPCQHNTVTFPDGSEYYREH
jgi:hypothetical protein